MKTRILGVALTSLIGVWSSQHVTAQVVGDNIGTGLPPATLGGYTMGAFDPGSIEGESGYAHETDGNWDGGGTTGWNTWGQNYTGNVYVLDSGQSDTLTLLLTGDTEAVDFYEEPNQYSDFSMTATDSSGVSVTTVINGYYGSSGVGFYESVAGGPYLTKITVTASDPTGFAIGEFGISSGGSLSGGTGTVPDTGSTILFMAVGLCGLMAYSKFDRTVKA